MQMMLRRVRWQQPLLRHAVPIQHGRHRPERARQQAEAMRRENQPALRPISRRRHAAVALAAKNGEPATQSFHRRLTAPAPGKLRLKHALSMRLYRSGKPAHRIRQVPRRCQPISNAAKARPGDAPAHCWQTRSQATGFDRAANQRLVLDRLATSCARPIGTGQSSARHGRLTTQNGKWRNVRVPFKQRGDIAKTLLRVLVNLPDLVANPAAVVVDDDIAAAPPTKCAGIWLIQWTQAASGSMPPPARRSFSAFTSILLTSTSSSQPQRAAISAWLIARGLTDKCLGKCEPV